MGDIPANRVDEFEKLLSPGDFMWTGSGGSLMFVCPCGCGSFGGVAVARDPADRGG